MHNLSLWHMQNLQYIPICIASLPFDQYRSMLFIVKGMYVNNLSKEWFWTKMDQLCSRISIEISSNSTFETVIFVWYEIAVICIRGMVMEIAWGIRSALCAYEYVDDYVTYVS